MSVAQYVRDAARERLGREESGGLGTPDPAGPLRARIERQRERGADHADSSDALREQGRLARERAAELRDEAQRRRVALGKTAVEQ